MHHNNWYYCNLMAYMVNDVSIYVSNYVSIGCYFCNIPPLNCSHISPHFFYGYGTNVIPPLYVPICAYTLSFIYW